MGRSSYRQIGVWGLGLMGGCLAHCIRHLFPDQDIVGISGNEEALEKALADGVITEDSDLACLLCGLRLSRCLLVTKLDRDGSGDLYTADHMSIGYYKPSPQAYLNGHIQRFIYYPKQLSDSQLKTLTSNKIQLSLDLKLMIKFG